MSLLDMLAMTPIVISCTPFGTTAVIDHYDRRAMDRATRAGLYHFKKAASIPEGFDD